MDRTREWSRALVESPRFQWSIIAVIVLNAAVLGVETSPGMLDDAAWVRWLGWGTVAIFVVEIALRIHAHGRAFFRDGWSLFDLFVVAVALIPASGSFAILRVLRVLRVLRLLSAVRSMRRVVAALVATIPGMASIGALLVIIVYMAAVMSTQMFAAADPDGFGSVPSSVLSLFRVMTGDNWSDVISGATQAYPAAWLFFIAFILVSTYVVLNLFIAVAVEALDRQHDDEPQESATPDGEDAAVLAAIAELRQEVAELRLALADAGGDQDDATASK